MKISCPSCSAKYSIADDKVLNRLAKIRCRKCSTTIVIDGKNDPPVVRAGDGGADDARGAAGVTSVAPVAAPSAQPGQAAGVYTVDVADNDQRSLTIGQIVEAYNTGVLTAETFVWREGMTDWESLADVPELNQALHAAAAAPRLSTETQAAEPTGNYAGSSLLEPKRAATTAGVGRDLFGGIDVAGSEFDTRTSIAGQDASSKGGPATGARNESSVLFSLSALTSGPDATPEKGSAKKDDSGLIDLAALAAIAPQHAAREERLDASGLISGPISNSAPLGISPLGVVAPPLGSVEAPKPAGSNRGPMFIGGGIAIAAIVVSLAYLLKEEPPAVTVAAPPAVSSAPATEPAAAASAPETMPAASSSAETSKPAGEAKDKPAGGGNRGTRPRGPSTPKQQAAAPEKEKPSSKPAPESGGEKPAATPPKKKCNCAPSDLMCAMKCSAK